MSSAGQLGRNRALSIGSGMSSKGRPSNVQDLAMSQSTVLRYFDPCAATASMLLYAQGNSVVCCHHDTLTIERRFSRHSDEVQLLAVDTQSELGAGRLVVSYDAGQTAIVWDLMTGDEVARFASYEHLTVASWMRNGNVAFGNTQGNIILFEPTTSEHISARTIDQIAVTALAPGADCRTFAIGYQNGSLLIATLQPRFTILHNLSTSRGPSPIVTLAWHASSSRQKSDMLAVQTNDGDLRVWSVSKSYDANDPAKVVRILRRTENYLLGPNWMGWSKNGRIIQFSESETLSWDVRTKHVTYDSIPTLDHIRGLAVYGPGATLFTLGANNTVQQFDLNTPSMMVANVQHPANLLPPSPPISLEEQDKGAAGSTSESESISIQINTEVSESDEDHMSPIARLVRGSGRGEEIEPYRAASPLSSHTSSVSRSSAASSRTPGRYQSSVLSRGLTENTYISTGSSIPSQAVPVPDNRERDSFSTSSLSSVSMSSSHNRPRQRPSRLRHEVPRSPEESKVQDLFKFTRSRLSDVPYKRPPVVDNSRLTNDDLRRQMLSIIFGWNKDVEDLIRDEMSRHPAGSASRILLAKWLGDIEPDIMATSSQNMTSSDWMLLALSGIGGTASQHKLGRAYVQRLLENGDLHAAATIMIGMGDHNDAIEIYVSHKRYMEALILSCHFFPSVWERHAQIIRKWGEWAVQHGQQQLAIRCFACTEKESSEPWTSPSAAQMTFQSINPSIPEILSPPLSPPGLNRGPQRSVAKNSALKLITSFGDQGAKSKYFLGADDGQTPIAAGVTPIAESALSPGVAFGGAFGEPTTAIIRPSQRSAFNTPSSARPTHGMFSRPRLPSIGEIPVDSPAGRLKAANLPSPPVEALPIRKADSPRASTDGNLAVGLGLARAATASPMMMKDTHRKRDHPPPSPSPQSMAALMEGPTHRNGPRNRIPDGIDLHLENVEQPTPGDLTSPDQSVASSARFHWPKRRGPGSVASSVTSASSAARSHRSHRGESTRHAGGKSLDDYIHSLDAASNYTKARHRQGSREGRHRGRDSSQTRKTSRERSGDRGRATSRGFTPKGPKRSPTSPVPMSPEDLINLSTPRVAETKLDDSGMPSIDIGSAEPATVRKQSARESSKPRTASRASSRGRRNRSPDHRPPALDLRGRSKGREGSAVRSPSSPLPMSAGDNQFYGTDDDEDLKRAVEAKEKFRNRASRGSARSARDPTSPISTRARDRSESRRRAAAQDQAEVRVRTPALQPSTTPGPLGDLRVMKEERHHREERQQKKEAAARELEERRKSLARRPLAPPIVHPDQLSPRVSRSPQAYELPSTTFVPPKDLPVRSQTVEPGATRSMYAGRNGPQIGLPATPKAMRLVLESDPKGASVPVPPIPATFAQASPPTSTNPSPQKDQGDLLTLLPSTVYSPPSRPLIPRSMSAPPEELAPRRSVAGGGNSGGRAPSRGQSLRKLSIGTIDEQPDGRMTGRRSSHDEQMPPPPPPPPVLKELAHLVTPPPPPPVPLAYGNGQKPVVYGGQTSGMIEIVMDDDQPAPPPPPPIPVAAPISEATVPIIAPPAPPSSRNGHHRGRSSIDNSIAGRISRAAERVRSASRSRTTASLASRTKSPEMAPYESIPPPPISFQSRAEMKPSDLHLRQQEFRSGTGLLESEMI